MVIFKYINKARPYNQVQSEISEFFRRIARQLTEVSPHIMNKKDTFATFMILLCTYLKMEGWWSIPLKDSRITLFFHVYFHARKIGGCLVGH